MVLEQEENLRGGGGGWSRSLKKPKLPKAPPQRGLGVEQLEKILREQEQKSDDSDNKAEFTGPSSSLICSLPHTHHSPVTPPPPVIMPPLNNLYSNSLSAIGGGGDVHETGGSAMVLPEHDICPSMWSSHEWNSDGEAFKFNSGSQFSMHFPDKFNPVWPSPSILPAKHCQYPPWVMNLLMPSAPSSSSSSSTGMNHQIEPPSNQRSYSYTSFQPEQEQTVGTKRQWPFRIDDQPAHFYPHRADPPSSGGYGSTICFEPSKEISRDLKKGLQPKQNSKKGHTDCGNLDASFGLPPASSQSAQTIHEEFPENRDDPPQSSGHGGPGPRKPFYSFFPTNRPPVGWAEATTSSNYRRRGENEEDGVDLNLKL